jgi:hypothetical protein
MPSLKGLGITVPKNRRHTLRIHNLIEVRKFKPKTTKPDEIIDPIIKEIEIAFGKATSQVVEALGLALDQAMMTTWPPQGDIIDTSRLKNARQITNKGNVIDIRYDVPYFGIVHFGGYIQPYGNKNAEKVYIPARPWITYTVEGGGPVPKFDAEAVYEKALSSLL